MVGLHFKINSLCCLESWLRNPIIHVTRARVLGTGFLLEGCTGIDRQRNLSRDRVVHHRGKESEGRESWLPAEG